LSTEETDGGRILAAISDTGHGIPPDLVPHLFEPFFSTKPEGQGSGLGLAISSWIVKKLGGTIDVTSEAGRGSTFCVTLPAAQSREERTEGRKQ
jgi:signal transduction histidine kinase